MLIDQLIEEGYLKTPRIIQAFRKIKREDFVREEERGAAGLNLPLPIGEGQTISQPLTVAFMLENLGPREGDAVLDVGSGSGWTTALLAEIVGERGAVFGIERLKALKEFGDQNISKYNFLKKGVVKTFEGDGRQGLPEFGPFDRILVSAAVEQVPAPLLDQLKITGRLVIPVGKPGQGQEIAVIDRANENEYEEESFPGFLFVPLI